MSKLLLSPWKPDFSKLEIPLINASRRIFSPSETEAWLVFLRTVGAGDPALDNANEIGNKNVLTVISGQQIGLGIGPLLSLFKIFAIESLADYFSKKFERKVAPVFWLQTEDHDLAEILPVNLLNEDFNFSTITPAEVMNLIGLDIKNRRSVGGLSIDKLASILIKKIEGKFLKAKSSSKFRDSIETCQNLASSYAKYFYSIFPESSVAFFDIRNEAFKNFKSRVFLKALERQEEIDVLLKTQSKKIRSSGKEIQVKIREHSPLFFYHPSGAEGDRFRLTKVKNNFYIEETGLEISSEKIKTELTSNPEKFSSSALLRPLLQDSIFNTLFYVGGAAEISYLEQIEPLYKEFGLRMPYRLQRPSGVIIDNKSFKHFAELKTADIFKGKEHLVEQLINREFRGELNPQNILALIDEKITQIEKLLTQTLEVDATLANPKLKTVGTLKRAVSRYMEKYKLSLVRNESVMQGRIRRLISQCYPGGVLQERVISVYSIELLYGEMVFSDIQAQFNDFFKENVSNT